VTPPKTGFVPVHMYGDGFPVPSNGEIGSYVSPGRQNKWKLVDGVWISGGYRVIRRKFMKKPDVKKMMAEMGRRHGISVSIAGMKEAKPGNKKQVQPKKAAKPKY